MSTKTVTFRRYGVKVFEWDPTEHNGKREPWELMGLRLDAAWPLMMTEAGFQTSGDRPVTTEMTDDRTGQRYLVRMAWVLPLEVPADIASRAYVDALGGYLSYASEDVL